jgi:hypothetical protein
MNNSSKWRSGVTAQINRLTPKQIRGLKIAVRCALAFGIVVSIGANAIHAVNAALAAHDSGGLLVGSVVLAGLAPVFGFMSLEMVVRVPIHSRIVGAVRLAITLILAGFAGWISYWNIAEVASMLHEHPSRYVWPWVIDGMMLVATISLVELTRYGQAAVQQIDEYQATLQAEEVAQVTATLTAAAEAARRTALRDAQKTNTRYAKLSPGDKARWTKKWLAEYDEQQRRAAAVMPVSPAVGPVRDLTPAEDLALASV